MQVLKGIPANRHVPPQQAHDDGPASRSFRLIESFFFVTHVIHRISQVYPKLALISKSKTELNLNQQQNKEAGPRSWLIMDTNQWSRCVFSLPHFDTRYLTVTLTSASVCVCVRARSFLRACARACAFIGSAVSLVIRSREQQRSRRQIRGKNEKKEKRKQNDRTPAPPPYHDTSRRAC